MHRFYPEPSLRDENTEYLTREDAHHALKVLRLHTGDRVEIVSDSCPWIAEIAEAQENRVALRKLEPLPSTEPVLQITLYQGLPKADKMDWIVQKSTELGVTRIVPVLLSRCITRIAPEDRARKTERWQKIAREAGKQSGRCVIPSVECPVTLQALLKGPFLSSVNVVPWEEAQSFGPLAFHRTYPDPRSMGIMIGPEGGITTEEIALLTAAGFIQMTLGKRILRTETAGLAVLSALMCLYGEMEQT